MRVISYNKEGLFLAKCTICGNEFKAVVPNQRTCDDKECKKEQHRRSMVKYLQKKRNDKPNNKPNITIIKHCKMCEKQFEAVDNRKKYCSEECRKESIKKYDKQRKKGSCIKQIL